MPTIQPFIDKFAADATPLNLALLMVILGLGLWIWRRERRHNEIEDKLASLALESVRAGLASVEAQRSATEEARIWREELQHQRHVRDRGLKTLDRVLDRLERSGS